jgi:hypothetical protein
MLEKPITTTYDESLKLIEIAKKNNVVLTTYQNRRWYVVSIGNNTKVKCSTEPALYIGILIS